MANLLAHYKCNDNSASTAVLDYSGNDDHAMFSANVASDYSSESIAGSDGQGFLGANHGGDLAFETPTQFNCGAVSLWLSYDPALGLNQPFFDNGDGTYGSFYSDGSLVLTTYNGDETLSDTLTGVPIVPNRPFHLLLNCNGIGDLVVYINGIYFVAATNWNLNFIPVARIGALIDIDDGLWNGLIDEVKLYDAPLDQEQITALSQERTNNPLFWWKCADNSAGQIVFDSGDNGQDGTITGATNTDISVVGPASPDKLGFLLGGNNRALLQSNNTQGLSISLWIKYVSGGVGTIQSIFGNEDNPWQFVLVNSETLYFVNGSSVDGSIGILPTYDPTHLVISIANAESVVVYINGELQGSMTAFLFPGLLNPTVFGYSVALEYDPGDGTVTPQWNGLYDDIRLYPYVLTQAEINALYALGVSGSTTPAVYRMSLGLGLGL